MKNSIQPSIGIILAEIGGALLGGLLLTVAFYFAVGLLLVGTPWGQQLGMGVLTLQIYAAIFGFGIGAGLGVTLAGRLLGQSGSLWLALAGAILGGGLVALVVRLLSLAGLFTTLGIAVLAAVALAVLGYNLRR